MSQSLHYWYYRKHIEPSYMKPFYMISGLCTPESIGMEDSHDIIKLLRKSHLHLFVAKFIINSGVPVAVLISSIPLAMNATLYESIFVVIPWVIVTVMYVHFGAAFLLFNVNYFPIICYYLKLKVKRLNQIVKSLQTSGSAVNSTTIANIIEGFNSLHTEIQDINGNYWSQFLCIVLFSVICIMNFMLAGALFGCLDPLLRLTMLYIVGTFALFLLFILSTASTVGNECKKSYEVLYRFYVHNSRPVNRINYRIKVMYHLISEIKFI